MNGPPECGKVQIEKNVMEVMNAFKKSSQLVSATQSVFFIPKLQNGGSIVQNPGKETFCVIAHKANVRVQNIIK